MGVDGGSGRGRITLAFSLSAIERFEDPKAVFDDAREWSKFVGIVDNNRELVGTFVSEHNLQQDFDVGDRDIWLALEEIRETTATPRHVYVGATGEDRRVATQLGWEYLHVTDAADKADWSLGSESSDSGIVARFLNRVIPF